MKAPPDHLKYLQRRPFSFGCSIAVFPEEEYKLLVEYGNWMEALVQGAIQPVTYAQVHFLKVAREEVEPQSIHERAWTRLIGRREYEREQRISPPPSPLAEDYGIVEWDAERWW